ncbi:Gfo/Idh/MocA family oxidoreductase [bacterium]|nr:MAG: Gfo/Idh/MocA family oxidoreductase [bacterium]
MNSSEPRVVVIGCGSIARAHLGAIPRSCIFALCDRDLNAAHRLRDEFELDVPIFDSLEAALSATTLDCAIICTPPATHFELVHRALDSEVSILCEKPLALSAHESYSLIETARDRELTLRTSAKYRFCEGVRAAKSLLETGDAGAVRSAFVAFGSAFDFTRSWHANVALSGGGVWMDNGPHALDLARYFAGDLHLDTLLDWQCDGDLETEGHVRLLSESGIPIEILLSWTRTLGDHFAVLHCERGTLEIGWRETVWRPHKGQSRRIAGRYDKAASFAAQWQGFVGHDPRLGEEDGAHAVGLIEDIYRAASSTKCDSRATSPLCR